MQYAGTPMLNKRRKKKLKTTKITDTQNICQLVVIHVLVVFFLFMSILNQCSRNYRSITLIYSCQNKFKERKKIKQNLPLQKYHISICNSNYSFCIQISIAFRKMSTNIFLTLRKK